jgi:hypothetical protein
MVKGVEYPHWFSYVATYDVFVDRWNDAVIITEEDRAKSPEVTNSRYVHPLHVSRFISQHAKRMDDKIFCPSSSSMAATESVCRDWTRLRKVFHVQKV